MNAPAELNPHRAQKHIGLFLTNALKLGRDIGEGFSQYALMHPDWTLWPVYSAWGEASKFSPRDV